MTGLARTAGTVAPVSEQDGTSVLSPVEEADFVTRVEEFLTAHARRLGGPSPDTAVSYTHLTLPTNREV